jgi:hypothetical protein
MPESTSFKITFDVQLVPAERDQAEVAGYILAENMLPGGQPYGVFMRPVLVNGLQSIAAPAIDRQNAEQPLADRQ